MRLVFIGTGSAVPRPGRGFPSLALVHHDNSYWLFDCGEGTQAKIITDPSLPLKFGKLDAIFITHLHGDHIFGLFGLLSTRAMMEGNRKLTIVGPRGIKELVEHVLCATCHWMPKEGDVTQGEVDEHGNNGTNPSEYVQYIECDGDVCDVSEKFMYAHRDGNHVTAIRIPHGDCICYGYVVHECPRRGRLNADAAKLLGARGPELGLLATGNDVVLSNGTVIRHADVTAAPRPGRVIVITGDTSDATAVGMCRMMTTCDDSKLCS